jgi:hypothetical protein
MSQTRSRREYKRDVISRRIPVQRMSNVPVYLWRKRKIYKKKTDRYRVHKFSLSVVITLFHDELYELIFSAFFKILLKYVPPMQLVTLHFK